MKHSIVISSLLVLFALSSSGQDLSVSDIRELDGKGIPKNLLAKVTVHIENQPLELALNEISAAGNLNFNYSREEVPLRESVTLHMDDKYAIEALMDVLQKTNCRLFISGSGQLVIEPNKAKRFRAEPTATIKGRVLDAITGDPLPGATIMIEGTQRGTISDLRGNFLISGLDIGTYTLEIRFIGYESKMVEVTVNADVPADIEVLLSLQSIQGEEVVVYAQAAGQRAAINQQIASNSVVNVVASQRIQELPESSAAGAVSRLPGVSLKGGSLVIRGLSPHFNKVQIDGTDLASTSLVDRSSSLSMISQYMLEGIEMSKNAMAEHDADVLGARVNLILREAPKERRFEALFENGYNTLSKSFGNQKIVMSGSRRFFKDHFGVFGQVNYARSRSALNSASSNFHKVTEGVAINRMSLNDIDNHLKGRSGASLVMDYKGRLSKIKMTNFFSKSDAVIKTRSAGYDDEEYEQRKLQLMANKLTVMTSALRFEHVLGRFDIDYGFHYSYSKNDTPEDIIARATDRGAVVDSVDWQAHPLDIPSYSHFNIEDATMRTFNYNYMSAVEKRYTADLNLKTNIELGDWLNLDLKLGAKYRHQNKDYDRECYEANLNFAYFQRTRDIAHNYLDWFPVANEAGSNEGGLIGLKLFLDDDYSNRNLLLGDYELSNMLDESRVREFHAFMLENPMEFAFGEGEPYAKKWTDSYANDYHGYEDYFAGYIQPTFVVGNKNKLTIIPGLRYEKNRTNYTGFRIPLVGLEGSFARYPEFAELDVSRIRENHFLLPMIHVIYRPLNWFSIKSSYTNTLSRPRFVDIIPSWSVGTSSIAWNNPYLEPAFSKNFDIHFSAHASKLGLVTIGGFHKTIEDLIFSHGTTTILKSDLDENVFDGLQHNDKYVLMDAEGFAINYEMNNPRASYVSGLEFDYQSNFWFLPGVLNGLVFNANYSLFRSEAKYPSVYRELDYQTFRYTYVDTFYVDRLLDQAVHIFNVMLGFDYRDFSIRVSMQYTDDLFSGTSEEPMLREYTAARYDYSVVIQQKFPVKGLSVNCNITNLTRSRYVALNSGSGYPISESYGGLGIALGLRYRLSRE